MTIHSEQEQKSILEKEKNPFEAKQTLGKLQARAAQRELLRESKGTKAKLKKCVLKFASDSNEKMFF